MDGKINWRIGQKIRRGNIFQNFAEFSHLRYISEFIFSFLFQERGNVDTLRLMDLKEKPNIVGGDNVSEKEFLKLDDLGDGNYLTTSSTKESEI